MGSDLTKARKIIESYINEVGEKTIELRFLEKLDKLYSNFFDTLYDAVKKSDVLPKVLKVEATKIKKKKPPKEATKTDKAKFKQALSKELIGLLEKNTVLLNQVELFGLLEKNIQASKKWSIYEKWIDWALENGEGSYIATHIAKLTHSSSKGDSIDIRYFESSDKYASKYVYTGSNPIIDTAYPDNKFSSISKLYSLECEGKFIGDILRDGGAGILKVFTKDAELLNSWEERFSHYIKNEKKQSYFLSKQIYFPLKDKQYHLLLPLTSSSLVHAIHLEHKKYWSDDLVLAREKRNAKKYSPVVTKYYPNRAYIHVTGSNHSNASKLNGERGGRVALLSAQPPQWVSQATSYQNRDSVFDKNLSYALNEEITELRKYLLLIQSKQLSISEPRRNAAIVNKLQAISDSFFDQMQIISHSQSQRGWTMESILPIEEQLLLEPWRTDEQAKGVKLNTDWQKDLSKKYGEWLNRQLKMKNKLSLNTVHDALWAEIFAIELREYIAIQEVVL